MMQFNFRHSQEVNEPFDIAKACLFAIYGGNTESLDVPETLAVYRQLLDPDARTAVAANTPQPKVPVAQCRQVSECFRSILFLLLLSQKKKRKKRKKEREREGEKTPEENELTRCLFRGVQNPFLWGIYCFLLELTVDMTQPDPVLLIFVTP